MISAVFGFKNGSSRPFSHPKQLNSLRAGTLLQASSTAGHCVRRPAVAKLLWGSLWFSKLPCPSLSERRQSMRNTPNCTARRRARLVLSLSTHLRWVPPACGANTSLRNHASLLYLGISSRSTSRLHGILPRTGTILMPNPVRSKGSGGQ